MLPPVPQPGEENTAVELRLVREGGVVRLEPGGFSGCLVGALLLMTVVSLGFGLLPTVLAPTSPAAFRWVFFGIAAVVWLGLATLMIRTAAQTRNTGPLCTFDAATGKVTVPMAPIEVPSAQVAAVVLIKFRLASPVGGRSHETNASQAALLVRDPGAGERLVPVAMNPFRTSALRSFAAEIGAPFWVRHGGTHPIAAWAAGRLGTPGK